MLKTEVQMVGWFKSIFKLSVLLFLPVTKLTNQTQRTSKTGCERVLCYIHSCSGAFCTCSRTHIITKPLWMEVELQLFIFLLFFFHLHFYSPIISCAPTVASLSTSLLHYYFILYCVK